MAGDRANTAAVARKLWYAFVGYEVLAFAAVFSIAHTQLFQNSLIELPTIPLLNVKLGSLTPIQFFIAVPLLLILLHGALLFVLRNLILAFRGKAKSDAAILREHVFTIPGIGWITVVLGPILLLIFIQLKFLPYHNNAVTWFHRGALVVDVGLLWLFWLTSKRSWASTQIRLSIAFGLVTAVVLIFSIAIATFPGERINGNVIARATPFYRSLFLGTESKGPEDALTPNVLVLPEQRFADNLQLKDRDFQGAILSRAALRGADLTNSDLRRANLFRTDLIGSHLGKARLQEANLNQAELQGAFLTNTHFEEANLKEAHLEGSDAIGTTYYEGADLTGTHFEGARLLEPEFQGATLTNTKFGAALVKYADFSGSSFEDTEFDCAYLPNARLWRTWPSTVSACYITLKPHEGDRPPHLFRQSPAYEPPPDLDYVLNRWIKARVADLSPEGAKDLRAKLEQLKRGAWKSEDEKAAVAMWSRVNDAMATSCQDGFAKNLAAIICRSPNADYVLKGVLLQKDRLTPTYDATTLTDASARISDENTCPNASSLSKPAKDEFRQIQTASDR